MSLQDILQKILDEAKIEVERIKEEVEKEKLNLLKESEERQKEEINVLSQKKENSIGKVRNKIESMARRENKQKMLSVKHDIITSAVNSFINYLSGLPDAKYEKIMKKMLLELVDKEGCLLVPKNRLEVMKKIAPKGLKCEVDNNVKSGFIAKLERSEVDNTFENLVASEFYNPIRAFFAEKLNLI